LSFQTETLKRAVVVVVVVVVVVIRGLSGDLVPGVQQQVVKAGFDQPIPPLLVLVGLVKLLGQLQLGRVAVGELEGPQRGTQLHAVAPGV